MVVPESWIVDLSVPTVQIAATSEFAITVDSKVRA